MYVVYLVILLLITVLRTLLRPTEDHLLRDHEHMPSLATVDLLGIDER